MKQAICLDETCVTDPWIQPPWALEAGSRRRGAQTPLTQKWGRRVWTVDALFPSHTMPSDVPGFPLPWARALEGQGDRLDRCKHQGAMASWDNARHLRPPLLGGGGAHLPTREHNTGAPRGCDDCRTFCLRWRTLRMAAPGRRSTPSRPHIGRATGDASPDWYKSRPATD